MAPTKRLFATVAAGLMLTISHSAAQESTYATIYSFGKLPDGAEPHASLIVGPQGSLFGTTFVGGQFGTGAVFELTNPTGTGWTEQILFSFNGSTGQYPDANLTFGLNGDFFGTTEGGGTGGGTVFQLVPPSAESVLWTESVVFEFSSDIHAHVNAPRTPVLTGPHGILLATAAGSNGNAGGGIVGLAPPSAPGGAWRESTIITFGVPSTAGTMPMGDLVADRGHLYGTNYYHGYEFCGVNFGCGAVYEVLPPSDATKTWTVTPVYEFTGPPSDGAYPLAQLTVGPNGVLYGTTHVGGDGAVADCPGENAPGCGTIFQLTPPATPGGTWTETVLYSFTGTGGDGAYPVAPVIVGGNGHLYGTTQGGGAATVGNCGQTNPTGCGTVFELEPPTNPGGAWTEKILHSFTGANGDGAAPVAGLVLSPSGVLYGTTEGGGTYGKGTVFAIKP